MKKLLFCFALILTMNCSSERDNNFTEDIIIESIEFMIDSLNGESPKESMQLVDSVLGLDSTNYKALKFKGIDMFNKHKSKEAIRYLTKTLNNDSVEAITRLLLGWSYEREGEIDSSMKYYKLALPLMDENWLAPWMKPQIVTVLNGKRAGLKAVEDLKEELKHLQESEELFYYQLKNDIPRYENGGLSSMVS